MQLWPALSLFGGCKDVLRQLGDVVATLAVRIQVESLLELGLGFREYADGLPGEVSLSEQHVSLGVLRLLRLQPSTHESRRRC
jgi:hypothetical protein